MSDGRGREPDDSDDDSPFVVIRSLRDVGEAELLAQSLDAEGIECRVLGTGAAALVGVGQHVMPVRLAVRAHDRGAAEEVLRAFEEPAVSDDLDGPDGPDQELPEDEPPAREQRKLVVAVGAVILFFGGSHLYGRRPWTAACIAVTQLASLISWRASFPAGVTAWTTSCVLLVLDAALGARAAARWNRGGDSSIREQLEWGVGIAVAAVSSGVMAAWVTSR